MEIRERCARLVDDAIALFDAYVMPGLDIFKLWRPVSLIFFLRHPRFY